MNEIIAALILGATGSVHCLTMCGSMSVALGFSIPKSKPFWLYALFVSIGRVFGYACIGFVVNLLSQSIISLTEGGIFYLSILSGILMVLVALHIANISNYVTQLEKLGSGVNRLLAPIKSKVLPIDSTLKCLAYGLLWGFLPCGLVYTALTLAFVSPTPVHAFFTMLCFGLATLPALVGMTVFSKQLTRFFSQSWLRLTLASVIFIAASYQIYLAFNKLITLG